MGPACSGAACGNWLAAPASTCALPTSSGAAYRLEASVLEHDPILPVGSASWCAQVLYVETTGLASALRERMEFDGENTCNKTEAAHVRLILTIHSAQILVDCTGGVL